MHRFWSRNTAQSHHMAMSKLAMEIPINGFMPAVILNTDTYVLNNAS